MGPAPVSEKQPERLDTASAEIQLIMAARAVSRPLSEIGHPLWTPCMSSTRPTSSYFALLEPMRVPNCIR
jgi:hypothetical protein